MKKTIIYLTFGLTLSLISCGQSNSEGKEGNATEEVDKDLWTDEDLSNAKNNAKFSADADPELKTPEQRAKFCDCWVNEVVKASPDPMKQGEIPLEKSTEIAEKCRAEALK
ncbi:MAG: hypothetical protein RLZ33_2713 [Bacteroidota bacterium]|jgi:hypothetical protein